MNIPDWIISVLAFIGLYVVAVFVLAVILIIFRPDDDLH